MYATNQPQTEQYLEGWQAYLRDIGLLVLGAMAIIVLIFSSIVGGSLYVAFWLARQIFFLVFFQDWYDKNLYGLEQTEGVNSWRAFRQSILNIFIVIGRLGTMIGAELDDHIREFICDILTNDQIPQDNHYREIREYISPWLLKCICGVLFILLIIFTIIIMPIVLAHGFHLVNWEYDGCDYQKEA